MVTITWEQVEEIVGELEKRDSITTTFFGQEIEATLCEFGSLINGHFIALRTRSPEGYDTKFAIFDDDIFTLSHILED